MEKYGDFSRHGKDQVLKCALKALGFDWTTGMALLRVKVEGEESGAVKIIELSLDHELLLLELDCLYPYGMNPQLKKFGFSEVVFIGGDASKIYVTQLYDCYVAIAAIERDMEKYKCGLDFTWVGGG